MTKKKLLVTTPIFYPNAQLHLGHAYSMSLADFFVRYKKSFGIEVFFQTGSDEHGEKIFNKSKELNLTPQQLVDKNVALFFLLWKKLNISPHYFYRTSEISNQKNVQKIFLKLFEKGQIYFDSYRGKYCVSCETYVTSQQEINDVCSFCENNLIEINESAYFLRVKEHLPFVQSLYEKNNNFLIPEKARNEVINSFLTEGLGDLCVSRKKLSWGVPVPNNEKLSIYVWFEALLNYLISPAGQVFFSKKIKQEDKEIVHFIGKDITRFHSIYWPIILQVLNYDLPTRIVAHGWILNKETKMSKSKENVLDPILILEKYPVDVLRVYFIRKIKFLEDGGFSESLMVENYHDFFVNKLGNLISRINSMVLNFFQGKIGFFNQDIINDNKLLHEYQNKLLLTLENFIILMDNFQFTQAFELIDKLLIESNQLINRFEPWKIYNSDNLTCRQLLLIVLQGIKIVSFLLQFFTPNSAQIIFSSLGLSSEELNWEKIRDFTCFDKLNLSPLSNHLFPRLS